MKKLLIKILKYFLRKLQKPIHYEYKMSEKELKRINLQKYISDFEECRKGYETINVINPNPVEIGAQLPEIYVYHKSNFSVNMKNIPSRLIQDYYLIGNDEAQFEIILGGEIVLNESMDIYDELLSKSFATAINDKVGETIEIEIFSNHGYSRKIILENARVTKIDAFNYGGQTEEDLHRATVIVKYETKKIEKF